MKFTILKINKKYYKIKISINVTVKNLFQTYNYILCLSFITHACAPAQTHTSSVSNTPVPAPKVVDSLEVDRKSCDHILAVGQDSVVSQPIKTHIIFINPSSALSTWSFHFLYRLLTNLSVCIHYLTISSYDIIWYSGASHFCCP